MRTSSTGSTIPRPKNCAQMRLARFCRNSALSFDVSQSASATRGSFPFTSGAAAAQKFRRHGMAVEQMLRRRGAFGIVVDIELALLGRDLALHAGEEADEAVVIVLRPPVERMVVALRALHAHAREHLRHILRHSLRIVLALRQHGVKIHRRVTQIAARAGDLSAHELVEWRVPLASARGSIRSIRSPPCDPCRRRCCSRSAPSASRPTWRPTGRRTRGAPAVRRRAWRACRGR